MKKFYIFSLKHTSDHETVVTWWRPKRCGFTYYLSAAGKYGEEEIRNYKCSFNNGKDTFSVPCEEVDKVAHLAIVNKEAQPVVANNKENKEKLKKLALK